MGRIIETEERSFEWMGYRWHCGMEHGRLIHSNYPYMWYDKDNVCISENNELILTTERKEKEITHWDGKTYKPSMACGTIMSDDLFGHGTFSAVVRLPQGTNLWSAFWLDGDDRWPFCGEIDICESWSKNNRYFDMFTNKPPYIFPSWRSTNNIHYTDKCFFEHCSAGIKNVSIFKQPQNPSFVDVEYSCVWDKGVIEFFCNGRSVRKEIDAAIKIQEYWDYIGKEPKMKVIFDSWCENPAYCNVEMLTPMVVTNFSFNPLNV